MGAVEVIYQARQAGKSLDEIGPALQSGGYSRDEVLEGWKRYTQIHGTEEDEFQQADKSRYEGHVTGIKDLEEKIGARQEFEEESEPRDQRPSLGPGMTGGMSVTMMPTFPHVPRSTLRRSLRAGDPEAKAIQEGREAEASALATTAGVAGGLAMGPVAGVARGALANAGLGMSTAALESGLRGDTADEAARNIKTQGAFGGVLGIPAGFMGGKMANLRTGGLNYPDLADELVQAERAGYQTTVRSPGIRARPGTAAADLTSEALPEGSAARAVGVPVEDDLARASAKAAVPTIEREAGSRMVQSKLAGMDAEKAVAAEGNRTVSTAPILDVIDKYAGQFTYSSGRQISGTPMARLQEVLRDLTDASDEMSLSRANQMRDSIGSKGGRATVVQTGPGTAIVVKPSSLTAADVLNRRRAFDWAADFDKIEPGAAAVDRALASAARGLQKQFPHVQAQMDKYSAHIADKAATSRAIGVGVDDQLDVAAHQRPVETALESKYAVPSASTADRDALLAFLKREPDLQAPYDLMAGTRGALKVAGQSGNQLGATVGGGGSVRFGLDRIVNRFQRDAIYRKLTALGQAPPQVIANALTEILSPEQMAAIPSVAGGAATWTADKIMGLLE